MGVFVRTFNTGVHIVRKHIHTMELLNADTYILIREVSLFRG